MSWRTIFTYFYTDYVDSCADRIPNVDKYCLPTCLTKKKIYLTYADNVSYTGLCPVSRPTFSRMSKARFKNVIIPMLRNPELTNKIPIGKRGTVLRTKASLIVSNYVFFLFLSLSLDCCLPICHLFSISIFQ